MMKNSKKKKKNLKIIKDKILIKMIYIDKFSLNFTRLDYIDAAHDRNFLKWSCIYFILLLCGFAFLFSLIETEWSYGDSFWFVWVTISTVGTFFKNIVLI